MIEAYCMQHNWQGLNFLLENCVVSLIIKHVKANRVAMERMDFLRVLETNRDTFASQSGTFLNSF